MSSTLAGASSYGRRPTSRAPHIPGMAHCLNRLRGRKFMKQDRTIYMNVSDPTRRSARRRPLGRVHRPHRHRSSASPRAWWRHTHAVSSRHDRYNVVSHHRSPQIPRPPAADSTTKRHPQGEPVARGAADDFRYHRARPHTELASFGRPARYWSPLLTVDLLNATKAHVPAIIEHATRRIQILGVTAHPNNAWMP
jgi:hypothetical protein